MPPRHRRVRTDRHSGRIRPGSSHRREPGCDALVWIFRTVLAARRTMSTFPYTAQDCGQLYCGELARLTFRAVQPASSAPGFESSRHVRRFGSSSCETWTVRQEGLHSSHPALLTISSTWRRLPVRVHTGRSAAYCCNAHSRTAVTVVFSTRARKSARVHTSSDARNECIPLIGYSSLPRCGW
jgi:hypothetical protein